MRTKVLIFLLVAGAIASAAWLVQASKPVQADDVPEKYRETVRKGLEFLVTHQLPDGHWEGDGGKHPVAMTGLAGLALVIGNLESKHQLLGWASNAKYLTNMRKAADWLMHNSQSSREGLIFSGHPSETTRYMEGHGLATLFLAGVCQHEPDQARKKKLTDVLTRAVKYIAKARSSRGGWYHTSRVEGHDLDDLSATVIQVQALQAAQNAGIAVSGELINDALEYLKTAVGEPARVKPAQHAHGLAETAGALACRLSPQLTRFNPRRQLREMEMTDECCTKWLKYCQTEITVGRDANFGRDDLAHYYYGQAVFSLGTAAWNSYRTAMFDQLKSRQNKDGSWASDKGISSGRVYSTALWCTVLQLDKGIHPSRVSADLIEITRVIEPSPPLARRRQDPRRPDLS